MSAADPNRYAGPAEAALLRGDIAAEEGLLQTVETRRAAVRSALHDAEQRIRAAHEEADSARAILIQLDAREAHAQQSILRARGLLHPVRRLPDDVLFAIFRAWADEFKGYHNIVRRQYVVGLVPFLAASVCRRWRSVALNTAALWTKLYLSVDAAEERPIAWTAYMKSILKRSRTLGLDIFVRFSELVQAETPSTATLFNILLSKSMRWRTLHVTRPSRSPRALNAYLQRLVACNDAPILESLILDIPTANDPIPLLPPQGASRLHTIALYFTSLQWAHCPQMNCVAVLKLGTCGTINYDVADLDHIAISMPNLERLELDASTGINGDPIPITFPRLHFLKVSALSAIVAQCFRCPMLDELAISSIESAGDADAFVSFVESALSPNYRLRKLVVNGPTSTLRSAVALGLKQLHSLDEVATDACTFDSDFFLALSRPNAAGEWCAPRLRRLRLSRMRTADNLLQELVAELTHARESASNAGGPNAPSVLTDVVYDNGDPIEYLW